MSPSVIPHLYQDYFCLHLRLWSLGLSTFKSPARNSLSSTTNQRVSTETLYSISKTQLNSPLWPVSLMWSYDLFLSASLIPSLILCFNHKSHLSVPLGLQFYYHLSPYYLLFNSACKAVYKIISWLEFSPFLFLRPQRGLNFKKSVEQFLKTRLESLPKSLAIYICMISKNLHLLLSFICRRFIFFLFFLFLF